MLSEFLIGIFYLSLNYYSRTENRRIFTHQGEVLCHLLLLILCYIYSHNSVYLFFLKCLICICSHFTKWFLSFVVGLRRPVDTTDDFHFYFSVLGFCLFHQSFHQNYNKKYVTSYCNFGGNLRDSCPFYCSDNLSESQYS